MSNSTKEQSVVTVKPTEDGQWEVSQWYPPYPKDASKISVEFYHAINEVVEAHFKQTLGKLLTFLDSFGDSDRINKARKDLLHAVIKSKQEDLITDIIHNVGLLDEWLVWYRENNANDGNTGYNIPHNKFSKISNLE